MTSSSADPAAPKREPRGRGPARFAPVFAGATIALAAAWAVGQVARDATFLTGLCFFVPSPVLAAVLLGAAAVAWRSGRKRVALAAVVGFVPPAAMIGVVENRWSAAAAPAEPALRLLNWNVMYGALGVGGVEDEILRHRADLTILVEAPARISLSRLAAWIGPEASTFAHGSLRVVARGPLEATPIRLGERGITATLIAWTSPEGPLRILFANLASDVSLARDPPLRELRRRIESLRPDLVVGDLNSPRRSRALEPLPAGYRHAYDVAGRGWSYSWPVPVPVYAIDQCIVGERIVAVRYRLRTTLRSDHRLQILDFALRR